jgi:hypothetical protein
LILGTGQSATSLPMRLLIRSVGLFSCNSVCFQNSGHISE